MNIWIVEDDENIVCVCVCVCVCACVRSVRRFSVNAVYESGW